MKTAKRKRAPRVSKEHLEKSAPEIRVMYATGRHTQEEIAAMFRVSPATVVRLLTAEDREAHRAARQKASEERRSMISVGVVEEWKTGDYTSVQLGERWGHTRKWIGVVLREAGMSARDFQYRNRRIGQLYAAGQSIEALAEHYGATAHHIRLVIRGGSWRGRERICPVCDNPFTPRQLDHIYCIKRCAWEASRKRVRPSRTCSACGTPFPPQQPDQQVCGLGCVAVLSKIKTIEASLRVRQWKRQGFSYREISDRTGLTNAAISIILAGPRRSEYLAAIETVRRHAGKPWLSGLAELEVKRAWAVLKAEGLDYYVRTHSIENADVYSA